MSTEEIYSTAIVFSVLAWLSWLGCVAPLIWHISQRNVAASSLVAWMILANFPLGINAIIWGHDNIDEWWDGHVWCDIISRLQVGTQVSVGAAIAMILRRLAQVMDTRNMTVSPSRGSKMRRNLIELAWCWGYPLVLILFYIPIQSVRYQIWGIEGCNSAYDPTWKVLLLTAIWVPLTMCFVVYYAVLLLVRLYRYRREFSRLITASNSTRSRFLRLFLMCMVFLLVVVPYSFYPFYYFCAAMSTYKVDEAWWNSIKDHRLSIVSKFESGGMVHADKWGQIGMGFVTFLLFGTGTDAHNTYKKMLLALGLGKFFPSLYVMRDSGTSTPTSQLASRLWTSSYITRAKSFISKRSSIFSTSSFGKNSSVRSDSVVLDSFDAVNLHSMSSATPVLPLHNDTAATTRSPLLKRLFARGTTTPAPATEKPRRDGPTTDTNTSASASTSQEGFSARAWASQPPSPCANRSGEPTTAGVVVFREVLLDEEEARPSAERREVDEWMSKA